MATDPAGGASGSGVRASTGIPAEAVRDAAAAPAVREVAGGFVSLDGEEAYRIAAFDLLPPFLMNVPSDADLWMFLSSRGGLTAGRVDAGGSLFPYETVDRLHDAHHHTGPITLIRVRRGRGDAVLWEPFAGRFEDERFVSRNLYKNPAGNRVVFEEIRHDLALAFRYRWSAGADLGWVRTVHLANLGEDPAAVSVLDGLRNVLPFGVPLSLLQQAGSLADAYKRVDCDSETRLAVFSLTSKIVDRPEAAEELRANTVWTCGLPNFEVRLSHDAIAAFSRGEPPAHERLLTGRRGNYLVASSFPLAPRTAMKWHLVADVGRDHPGIAALQLLLRERSDLDRMIEESLDRSREHLLRNIGSADGLQFTGERETSAHHLANVLFNNMRGGVFVQNDEIPASDFNSFVAVRNAGAARRHAALIGALPRQIALADLLSAAGRTDDPDLLRLAYEYLPLHFSRRHGDPSRPWNRFEIRLKNRDGSPALRYEGNWRDIFQNWEALAFSFPDFLPNMIAKFLNASTVDGFNPYRINRDGFEWEVADPNDPWSHIGYWGDHQIVYLLRLLEALGRFAPGALDSLLDREIFCYAEVPYRIRPYAEIVHDPHATIDYDRALASRIEERVRRIGTDGKLVRDRDGSVYHASLIEKLLVPALSKLSNFVPGGGIWMNTQRPEWNDANNALAGRGLSVVTLCYLRRYLQFLEELLQSRRDAEATLSTEVCGWLRDVHRILDERREPFERAAEDPHGRKAVVDALGEAFSGYRAAVYAGGFSGKEPLPVREILALCRAARERIDRSIRSNRRDDGLYHSYNLLEIPRDGKGIEIRRLHEMLEGQVAALSSGVVEPDEALRLVSSLFESRLYRGDQRSFLLFPEKDLPSFLEKNVIPEPRLREAPLLRELLEAGEDSIAVRDALGVCRFGADLRNARDLSAALDRLATTERWREPVARGRAGAIELFQEVFGHKSFMGRSGAMYGYEGLGCVYWHMVSKLLLAVQEAAIRAHGEEGRGPLSGALGQAYYLIRSGLGFEKTAKEYGAFPTDPYSHTPRHAGAQQPGMTGQVKEEILARFGELGVQIEEGRVRFRPVLLRRTEFRTEPGVFRFFDRSGAPRSIEVAERQLAFTFCQVPVVFELIPGGAESAWIRITLAGGATQTRPGDALDAGTSRALFERTGLVSRIDAGVPESGLFDAASGSTGRP